MTGHPTDATDTSVDATGAPAPLVDAFTAPTFAAYPARWAVAQRGFFRLCTTAEEAQSEVRAWHPNDRPVPRARRSRPRPPSRDR